MTYIHTSEICIQCQVVGGIFVPKKIENPLFEGLPSKICYYCYFQPETGYGLAKKIHGSVKGTDKIYNIINDLVGKGFLNETKITKKGKREQKPVTLDTKILRSEITKQLERKGISFNSETQKFFEKQLLMILNSTKFKEYARSYHSSSNIADGLNRIIECIGMLSTLCHVSKKFKKSSASEDLSKLEKSYKRHAPNDWRTMLESVEKFNAVIPLFEKFDVDDLVRLSKLWFPSDTIIYSHYVNYFKSMEETK